MSSKCSKFSVAKESAHIPSCSRQKQHRDHRSRFFLKAGLASIAAVIGFSGILTSGSVLAAYRATNRDTLMAPEAMDLDIPWENKDEFAKLYENDNFIYSYKENTQVVAVTDKRNGYTWTSGIDILTNREIDDMNDEAEDAGQEPPYLPKEDRLNTIYTGIANTLVTLEYYDDANNLKRSSISKDEKVDTEFKQVSEDHYVVEIDHREPEAEFNLHIRFTENGLNLSIPASEMKIDEDSRLSAIILAPFLGSAGGVKVYWNEEEQDYSEYVPNEMKPGYILVPDGPGALIRFRDNAAELEPYVGDVYGPDPAQRSLYYYNVGNAVENQDIVMPVYGVAHGQDQNAFVAYAESGAEYMEVVVQPEENMTYYYYAYPRFTINPIYFQPYNKKGDGFFSLMENPNLYDISMNYDFLCGDGSDGSPAANYVGMAQRYKAYLQQKGQLPAEQKLERKDDIPIRLDFIMADAEKAVIGYRDAVLTTAEDAEAILDDMAASGISNINSGLLGWQKGGVTRGRADRARFTRTIGTKGTFEDLFSFAAERGIDLSLSQDYVTLTDGEIGLAGNAAKHVSGYYAEVNDYGLPQPLSYYARTSRSLDWLAKQTGQLDFLASPSYTIQGLGSLLVTDYRDENNIRTLPMAREAVTQAIGELSKDAVINLETPNNYLWAGTDRFLQAPVYSSQHLVQTDNVPFLQMVLNGTMEVYAPYANFSFYTQPDILRMIDFNVYPSFVLTEESAHLLAKTNLIAYYSTEYSFYKNLIENVYSQVNEALAPVQGAEWLSREVVKEGVVVNHYAGGQAILINYTDERQSYEGQDAEPLSYVLIEE